MTDIATGRVFFLQDKIKELIEAYDKHIDNLEQNGNVAESGVRITEVKESIYTGYPLVTNTKPELLNCLSYALRFWNLHPKYKIYYNGDHVINSDEPMTTPFLPIGDFGYHHMLKSFVSVLTGEDVMLLNKYFNR
jgi:hypothetical protein